MQKTFNASGGQRVVSKEIPPPLFWTRIDPAPPLAALPKLIYISELERFWNRIYFLCPLGSNPITLWLVFAVVIVPLASISEVLAVWTGTPEPGRTSMAVSFAST